MALDDKRIRECLKKKLFSSKNKPASILDELSVENGRAIADVVAVYKTCHCYEIKSDLDSLTRLDRQVDFYNRVFEKITLVITEKHLSSAFGKIPDFWGVMVAKEVRGEVRFSVIRRSGLNKNIEPASLLISLWREELVWIYEEVHQKNTPSSWSRDRISMELTHISKRFALEKFSQVMSTRLQRKSLMM